MARRVTVLVEQLHDDAEVTRDLDGTVVIVLSTWLRPAQRLVALAWIAGILRTEPRSLRMVAKVHVGAVMSRTPTTADRRLAELMDSAALTPAQRADVAELVLR